MSDTTRESIARLFMDWGCDDESAHQCVGQLLAEFLVIPRSAVVGTEYGWRFAELGMPEETWLAEDRSAAVGVVRSLQREQARDPIFRPGPQLLERPRLPWSVIPLPFQYEDGDGNG